MLATSGGSMSSATSLTLPSGHLAVGVDHGRLQRDGDADLVVEVNNTNVEDGDGPVRGLDLFDRQRLGRVSATTSTYQTVGQPDCARRPGRRRLPGLQPRASRSRCPSADGGGSRSYIDIVPLS